MALLPTFSTLGSGPTVLMLHDADGDHLTFAPQLEMLASAGYRAVAWDMPGYGRSAPIEPYTFKGLAQSCLALIDALQCGPVTLVGHGMGAMLALEVAVRRAEVVRRLVLCAGGPALDAQAVQDWLAPRERALDAVQQPGGSMQQLAQTLVPQCIGTAALPEGVRLAEHALAQVHPATYRRALQAMQGFDRWAQAWVNVHTPTLLLGGDADHCTPPAALQALAELMPDAQHLSLPHIGHWPQLEHPEAFDAALLDFLATQRVLH
jgi:pimeloyl-ACP methyl ester carboxylesterase